MKKILTIIILLIKFNSFSQFQNTYGPYGVGGDISGIAIKDNFLYFAGSYNDSNIYKINLSLGPNQTATFVANTGSTSSKDLLFNGNDLYISIFSPSSIRKIDVTQTPPAIVDVLSTGIDTPKAMIIYNNYLYFGETYGYKISRLNLSSSNPFKEVVISYANSPWSLQLYGNEIYVAETYGNKISKFNLLDLNPVLVNVVSDISYPYCISVKDNFLYYENNTPNNSKILRRDLTSTSSSPVDVIQSTNFSSNRWIIENNILYKGSGLGNILRLNLNTLANDNFNIEKQIDIYPNPTSTSFKIKNLQKSEKIKMINNLGQIVKEIIIGIDQLVNIEDLEKGIYYIQTENYLTYKLLKK